MLRIPSFTFANAVVVLGIFWPAVLREIGHRRGKKQSQSKCSFQRNSYFFALFFRFIFFFHSWNRSHRRLRGVVDVVQEAIGSTCCTKGEIQQFLCCPHQHFQGKAPKLGVFEVPWQGRMLGRQFRRSVFSESGGHERRKDGGSRFSDSQEILVDYVRSIQLL